MLHMEASYLFSRGPYDLIVFLSVCLLVCVRLHACMHTCSVFDISAL